MNAGVIKLRIKSYIARIVLDAIYKLMSNPQHAMQEHNFLTVAESPRSLNACDQLYLPRIIRDFPDFDNELAKTYIKDYLRLKFDSKNNLIIHRVGLAKYLPTKLSKTIVYQAAISWHEHGSTVQKRFDLNYTYLMADNTGTVAANCPNCAGPLGLGEAECPYCGSRVASALGQSWKVSSITES